MRYFSLSDQDIASMLQQMGHSKLDDLFAHLPQDIIHKHRLNLPDAKEEYELQQFFTQLSDKNLSAAKSFKSYLGAGAYEHFVPYVVDALSSRGEFATAYTPYQGEISQGTLQAIYEFQSMTASLLQADVANASMYDGASALAEAVLMALRVKRNKKRVLVSKGIHPEYIYTLKSYLNDEDCELEFLDLNEQGHTVLDSVKIDDDIAAFAFAYPNFYGVVEPVDEYAQWCEKNNILSISSFTESLSFGLINAPGALGVDIITGEGQSLGNHLSFGGPYVGLMACKQKYLRQMPGRLVGETVDESGEPGYVLTLSTREQHIRRQKATSNICTNNSLCALRSAIYMSCMGSVGLQKIALNNHEKSEYLKQELSNIDGIDLKFQGQTFNEFCISINNDKVNSFIDSMAKLNIAPGVPLSRFNTSKHNKFSHSEFIVTVTETKTEQDLDAYIDAARTACK